jgi:hypothetical protein
MQSQRDALPGMENQDATPVLNLEFSIYDLLSMRERTEPNSRVLKGQKIIARGQRGTTAVEAEVREPSHKGTWSPSPFPISCAND